MVEKQTVLFAPLNWGLGHATRMVPLINNSLLQGDKVIIGADGAALEFLKLEFPQVEIVKFWGFSIRYARQPFFLFCLLLQMPVFYGSIWIEHFKLKRLIKHYKISTIISDNRYGLWNTSTKSILLSHQLFIQLPKAIKFLEPTLHWVTALLIRKFDVCWVPDYQNIENSLSGKLSHGTTLPKNVTYIGPLSRFNVKLTDLNKEIKDCYEVVILISGPEPQRTHFENEMTKRFALSSKKVLMVCGKPGNENKTSEHLNIIKVEHLNTAELIYRLLQAKHIIARSGYSTLMDLHALHLKAEFIPTKGQTEQEYLARWMKNK
jgi:hypothetical protein